METPKYKVFRYLHSDGDPNHNNNSQVHESQKKHQKQQQKQQNKL